MDRIDERIQKKARKLLDESVEGLDKDTVYRLQLVRGKVLQNIKPARPARRRIALIAASLGTVLFAAALIIQQPVQERIGIGVGKDHRMSVEGPDEDALYEDLDFYIWLSSKEWPS